ncbi:MAG: hypothetical protein ACI4WZ_01985 [Eubacteriales bacterium]
MLSWILVVISLLSPFRVSAVDSDYVDTTDEIGKLSGILYFYDFYTKPSGLTFTEIEHCNEWTYIAVDLVVWYPSGETAYAPGRFMMANTTSVQMPYWNLDSYETYQGNYTAQSSHELINGNDAWGFFLYDTWDYETMRDCPGSASQGD